MEKLATRQEAETFTLAQKNLVALDSQTYSKDARTGFTSTLQLVRHIQPDTPSYEDNCREVREKVQKKIASLADAAK